MIKIGNEIFVSVRIIGIELLGGIFDSQNIEMECLKELFDNNTTFHETFMMGRNYQSRIALLYKKNDVDKILRLTQKYTNAVYNKLLMCDVHHEILSKLREAIENHFSISIFSVLPKSLSLELLKKVEMDLDAKLFVTEMYSGLNFFPDPDLVRACMSFYHCGPHEILHLASSNAGLTAVRSAGAYYCHIQNKQKELNISFN